MHNHDAVSDAVWHKYVQLKVSICVWRLFRNRLPTKGNLQRRSVIPLDGQSCVAGCSQNETAEHLIIQSYFWFSLATCEILARCVFSGYASGRKISRCSLLHMIWLCCIWVL